MAFLIKCTKWFGFLMTIFLSLGQSHFANAQDRSQLAIRARINLYDTWNFDSCAFYFKDIIGKKGTPAFAYSDYGWYLMLVDQFDDGLTYIQRAAEMASEDKQLLTWNAWALQWNGDLVKAQEWIERALSIDPDYGEALHVCSRIASEMGNHQEAIRLAELAGLRDPNWRGVLPVVLVKAGNSEQARLVAMEIAQDEKVFDFWFLMEAYAALGNVERALDYLVKAYEQRFPFLPWLELAPGLKQLHDKDAFRNIVNKMNLPR